MQIQNKALIRGGGKKKLKPLNLEGFDENGICVCNTEVSAPDMQFRFVTACRI